MSSISLRLPESLHRQARALAEREDISINQLIATALAEKMSALMTGEYLAERAARRNRKKFDRVLKKVRQVGHPPVPGDER
ncbi:MAG: toxin-antitoxin system HicB family antitoxin [bacterium]